MFDQAKIADREYLTKLSEQYSVEELVEKARSDDFFGLLVNVLYEPYCDDPTDLALQIFYKLNDERVLQLGIRLLQLENEGLEYCGFLILHEIKSPGAVPFLLSQLNDPDALRRGTAAQLLGEIGDERAVEPLILRFIEEGNIPSDSDAGEILAENAAAALGKIGSEKAFQFLITAFQDKAYYNEFARSELAVGLGHAGNKDATPALVAALKDESDYVRHNTAYGLSLLGDREAVEPLIEALEDSSEWVQKSVIYALGNLKDSRAIEPLTEILTGGREEVQSVVLTAFIEIGDSQVKGTVLQFIEVFKNKRNSVLEPAIEAVIHFKIKEALPALIEIYKQADIYFRQTPLRGLVALRGEEAAAIIEDGLTNGDTKLRSHIIFALKRQGSEADIPRLQKMANEPGIDDELKEDIAEAIKEIRAPQFNF